MSASGTLYTGTQIVSFTANATGAVTITAINGAAPLAANFFSLKMAEGYYAELVITGSTGTVDAVLQHSTDGGTTFRNLPLKFGQLAAGAGSAGLVFKPMAGLSDAAFATTGAATGAAQAFNLPFQQKFMQLFLTLGTAGATSGQLIFTTVARGQTVQ